MSYTTPGKMLRKLVPSGGVIADARLKEFSPRDRLLAIARMIRKLDLTKYDLSFHA